MMISKSLEILLVEDNPSDVKAVRRALEGTIYGSFNMTEVPRIADAIELIKDHTYGVILLGLSLPDRSGLDVLDQLLIHCGRSPIVILTESADEKLGILALRRGAHDFLTKSELHGSTVARAIRHAIERKAAEDAHASTEQRLEMAVAAAQVGTWELDLKTERVVMSVLMARMLGMEALEISANQFRSCIHPADTEAHVRKSEDSLKTCQPFHHEFRVVWADKTERWLEVRGRVICDARNTPLRMAGTAVDVTAAREAEAIARQREADLAHLSRVSTMGQMASGLAHELNQPLGAISNYAGACLELIKAGKTNPETIAEALGEVANEVRRAGQIISRLRSFVRKQQPQAQEVDINALLRRSIAMLEFELRYQDVKPTLELNERLPKVMVDEVQIEQVMVNLVYNALEAMGEHAGLKTLVIKSGVTDDNKGIIVSVRDSGPGIKPELLSRLFDPFFTTKSHGLGMGLNISRSIVENHGGRLSATLNGPPDSGMTFRMTLPSD